MDKVDPKVVQDLIARVAVLEKKVQVLEKQPSYPSCTLTQQAAAQNYKVLDAAALQQSSEVKKQQKPVSADSQQSARVKPYVPGSGFHQIPGESDSSDEM